MSTRSWDGRKLGYHIKRKEVNQNEHNHLAL